MVKEIGWSVMIKRDCISCNGKEIAYHVIVKRNFKI